MISFRSPCSVFATKYNLSPSGVLYKMQATTHFLFTSWILGLKCNLPLWWTPAQSLTTYFPPHLLFNWLFPTSSLLDKMGLATLVCTLWGPRPLIFYNIPQNRMHSIQIMTQSLSVERMEGWMPPCCKSHRWHLTDVILSLFNKRFWLHHLICVLINRSRVWKWLD